MQVMRLFQVLVGNRDSPLREDRNLLYNDREHVVMTRSLAQEKT
jgi:hypothetical protein